MSGSYWEKLNNERPLWSKGNETVFWKQGSQILQNIDDRMTLSGQVKRARDPVSLKISPEEAGIPSTEPEDSGKVMKSYDAPDIFEFSGFLRYVVFFT